MLKGQLWATSDINLVQQSIMNGFKVIYLGDPISIDPMYKDKFVMASSLVPDYQTMSLQVDGDKNGFINMYIASLNSKSALEMFSVIFTCLYRGTNILFYLPPEAAGLDYVQYLLQFIEMNYGITTQTNSTRFSFNTNFSGRISELMYLNNLISAQEFLINSTSLDDISLRKLVNELHPMVKDPTNINDIIKWFSNYKDELLKNNKLINGIQYAGEVNDYACC